LVQRVESFQHENKHQLDFAINGLRTEFQTMVDQHMVSMSVPQEMLTPVQNSFDSKFVQLSQRIADGQKDFVTGDQIQDVLSQIVKKCKETMNANLALTAEISQLRQEMAQKEIQNEHAVGLLRSQMAALTKIVRNLPQPSQVTTTSRTASGVEAAVNTAGTAWGGGESALPRPQTFLN
jgi:hypothetical protein